MSPSAVREHITTEQLVLNFDMTEWASMLLPLCRLEWLGHVGIINDDCLPKQILFGGLLSTRLLHGPKLRWKDVVQYDLENIGFDSTSWCANAMTLAMPWPPAVSLLPEPLLLLLDLLTLNVAETLRDKVI